MALDVSEIRRQFPILSTEIDGNPLVYLDWAATAQMPEQVIASMNAFSTKNRGNAHRGMHVLAERSTTAYEDARSSVQKFVNAAYPEEIIFTKSCTEAVNLAVIALSRGQTFAEGDAVVLTELEHHSNIVPWLQLKERKGIEILWLDCDQEGQLNTDQLKKYLDRGNVKMLSITAQSNVIGVRPDIKTMITMAHAAGAMVFVDAAQSIAHHRTDVAALDCDFLAFSGHKLYGPTGIGVLYGRKKHLQAMPPFLGGGMMIREVTKEGFTSADLPQKFEAGTPPLMEAVGLHAAIDWISQFSWKDIEAHEQSLLSEAVKALQSVPNLSILGSLDAKKISGCISFVIDGIHPHDLTEILGRQGICLRAGHHCAQVLHKKIGVPATTRLSAGIPTSSEDMENFLHALPAAIKKLGS